MDKKVIVFGFLALLYVAVPVLAFWAVQEPVAELAGEVEKGLEKLGQSVGYQVMYELQNLPKNCHGTQVESFGYGEEPSGLIRVDCTW